MSEKQEWDVETEYTSNDGLVVKNDLSKASKLFELNLALRIKRSKAYYALVERAARIQKAVYAGFGFLFIAGMAINAYFGVYKFLGVGLSSGKAIALMLVTALPIALIAGLFGALLVGIYIQKYDKAGKADAQGNMEKVIGQNHEMLAGFFADLLQERQVLSTLGFSVNSKVNPVFLEIKPSDSIKHVDCNGITLAATVSDGTKSADLTIELEFSAYLSTLKIHSYKVKKMMD